VRARQLHTENISTTEKEDNERGRENTSADGEVCGLTTSVLRVQRMGTYGAKSMATKSKKALLGKVKSDGV
jgi:hypothetical protein